MFFGKLQRERTNPRVKATTTFNASGTFFPEYGKTIFMVAGRGASGSSNAPTGGTTNPSTPGTTNPSTQQVLRQQTFTGIPPTSPFTTNSTSPGSWPDNDPPADYCEPFVEDNASTAYNGYDVCYGYIGSAGTTNAPTPGTTNPSTPGNSNTGASSNIFGVPFPGGVGGAAPVIGDTAITLAFSNAGYSVTVPAGGYVTFKNL
jgi:hypothetical protein